MRDCIAQDPSHSWRWLDTTWCGGLTAGAPGAKLRYLHRRAPALSTWAAHDKHPGLCGAVSWIAGSSADPSAASVANASWAVITTVSHANTHRQVAPLAW